jgi:flavin reductase (DIM6/NTAB) family NADH-FMN oxidoreductase RutF
METSKPELPNWAKALGRVSSGLYILTISGSQGETGMLASWVQQCSFTPPMVSVALKKGRYLLDWLKVGEAFGLNVIPEGNKPLLIHFGKGFEPHEPAFDNVPCELIVGQPPKLVESVAYLVLKVVHHYEAGDHVLVIGEVTDGQLLSEAKPATHSRKSGTHY